MHESVDQHLLEKLLDDNEQLALHNREHFDRNFSLAINIMSAPGAGKTTLIEATIEAMPNRHRVCVIEGDMVGDLDAQRLRRLGVKAFQISTGRACHLDASMVGRLLHHENLDGHDLVVVENVGNLVCPADFPLGEHLRVVLLSVTEGDDKPYKYPVIFRRCDAVAFTKCDLLAYVDFDRGKATRCIHDLNPDARIFSLSARTGDGMAQWSAWIEEHLAQHTGGAGQHMPKDDYGSREA